MSDPFSLAEDLPARRLTEAPKRALVQPARVGQTPFEAELLGRTGNGKVKVRMAGGTTFAVDRYRLHTIEKQRGQGRARLSVDQLDALPWLGAGPDPLLQPVAAKAPPWRRP